MNQSMVYNFEGFLLSLSKLFPQVRLQCRHNYTSSIVFVSKVIINICDDISTNHSSNNRQLYLMMSVIYSYFSSICSCCCKKPNYFRPIAGNNNYLAGYNSSLVNGKMLQQNMAAESPLVIFFNYNRWEIETSNYVPVGTLGTFLYAFKRN